MAKKMTFTADDFRGKSSNATFTAEDFRHDPFEKIREQEQAAAREAAIKRLYEQRNAPAKKMDGMNIVAAPTNPAQNQPTGGPTLASLGGAASMVRPATPQPAHTYTSAQHYLSSTKDLAYKIAEEKAAEEKRKAEQWYADKAKAAEDYASVSANADFQKMAAEGQKKTRTTESGFGASSIPEAFTADRMGALDRHRAYTDLSDDQKLVYDYYIGKGDSQSANAYLDAIRPQINAQRAEKRQAEAEAYAAEHPVLASVKSTVMSPLNIVPAASTFVDKLSDSLTGEYNPIDPNADVFAGVQTSGALRKKVSEDIAGGENATLPRKLASFGYDTLMSVADMATAAAVGGLGAAAVGGIGAAGASSALMAGGAMGGSLYEMKKDGASDTEAGQMAMLTGLAEWFSESQTFNRLEDVIARGSESLISNMAKEGGEEVFTELVESLGELSIREDESKLAKIYNSYIAGGASHGEAFMKTVGQELKQMGLAFAGGALAGGLGEAGAYGMYALNTMADGNDIKANAEAVAAITEQAKSAPESNTAKKLSEITGKYGSVENAPGFAVGKLAQVYYEDVQMEEQLAQEQAAAEYGDNVANVLRVAAEESARAVVQGDAGAENAPNLPVNEQRVDNSTPAPAKSASEALSKPAEASGVVSDSDAVVKETGEPVIVDKVASVENGTVYVEVTTNDGKVTMKADDVEMSGPAAEMVRESKYYSTARSANAFLEDYPAGVPVRNYMNAHKGMYLAGLSGEDFQKSLGYVSSFGIDEGILRLAYKYGEMDAKEIREAKKAPKKKKNAGVQESNAATRLRESSEQAKAELDAVDRITKALGISVEVHDHVEGANGYYHASGTIVLSADAFTGEYATKGILQIFAHELTHNLEDSSPEAWKKYRDFVVNYYRENDAVWFEDRMQKLEQLYEAAGKQITHEQILNEMAANATEEFLFDEAAVKALVKEDRPLAKKILGMIQDVITKLRSIMNGYKPNSPEAIHLKQSVAAYTEARKLWVEALVGVEEGDLKTGDADTKFSLRMGEDGVLFVEVDTDQSLFDGMTTEEMQKTARDIIKNRFKGKVIGREYKAYVTKTTAEHYAYPANRRMDEVQKQDKMRSAPELDLLIAASRYRENVPDDGRHPSATGGLDKLDTRFKVGEHIYDAEVTVLVTDRGKILYDITKLKDITEREIGLTQSAAETSSDVFRNSIREDSANVNVDSDGNELTESQMKFFKNSRVRDKDGNLLVMYHGTPNGNHTTFRSGTYFTEDPDYASVYQDPGASMLSSRKTVDNPKTYKVYLNITKPFDTRNPKERRIFMNEYYRKYGTGAPLADSGLPDWTDGMDLQEFIEEMEYDYDGLILDEGATGGYGDEVKSRGLSYVVFRSNQVKNVDNTEPTKDPDIRYSITEYTDEERAEHNKSALDYFGKTYRWNETGYILLKGERLDFSGRHEGGPGGYRTVDHRDIVDAIGDGYGDDTYSGAMVQFMSEGNIRISPESNGINLSVRPTKAQETTLADFISKVRGEVIVDIDTINGDTVASVEYPRGTYYKKVLNDIMAYFDDGTVPEVSEFAKFYSIEEDERRAHERLIKQNARLQELNTELKRQLKITKEYTPKPHVLNGMARGFLRDYNSTYSQEQLEHDLDGLFRYIANAENIDNMHVSETAQIIARRILDESRMLDTTMQDQYGDLLSRLKRTKITVSKQDQGDFGLYGGFGAFKRQYRGKLNIVAEGGISVDALHQELADQYPELFDTDQYTSVSDQLMNLADTIDSCKPQYVNDYFMNNDEAVAMLAHEIYDRYSLTALNSPTFADRKKAELTRVRNQYKAKIETTKKEYRDKHKATLAKVREENREKIKKLKSAQNTATKDMVKDFNRQIKALENTHLQDLKAQEKRFAEERKQAIKQAKKEQYMTDRRRRYSDRKSNQLEGNPMPVHANSDAATEKALQEARDQYGIIEPGERRAREVNVPRSVEEGTKVRRFARTVMESGSVTDEMVYGIEKEILNGGMSYEPLSNAALYSKAERMVNANPESALASWKNIINSGGIPNAADIALGEALLKYYADAGDAKMVVELTTDIAAAGTRAGQSVQALRILKSLTEVKGSEYLGDLAYIKKTVDLMNKDLVKRKRKPGEAPIHLEINQDLAEKLAMATTAEEREAVCGEIYQDLADQLPTTWMDKWNAWRYLAMLGNPRTHVRNIVGNAVFVPAVTMKNAIGAALESAMGTKEKTKSITASTEYKEYASKDFEQIKEMITSDGKLNPKSEITSRQKIFKTKWLEWIREKNFDLMEKEDGAFLRYHYVSAMSQYMEANKVDINAIEGNEALLQRARNYAIAEAQKATYRDASKAAQAISNLGKESPALGFFVEGVLPFKKTPINVLKRGVEYSPIGLLDAISRKSMRLHRGEITVNEWIDSVASGLTGTAIVALGAFLASLGYIRGGYDEEKEKLEKLQGYQEYAIQIGNYTYTIDWSAPSSMPLFIGVEMWNAIGGAYDEKTFTKIVEALAHITEPMFNLSMLDGLNSTIEAVTFADNKFTALIGEVASSYLGQAVPSIAGQVARTIDPTTRKVYTDKNSAIPNGVQYFLQKVINKIPLLSFVNQPMLNQWGEEYENGNVLTRALENFLSPGYIERVSDDMVEVELSNLYDQTLDRSVVPQYSDKYFTVDGNRVDLTAEQYTQFQRVVGQSAYSILDEMIQSEGYDKLTPEAQVNVIKMVFEYSRAVGKLTLYEEYNADTWVKNFYRAYQEDGTSVADMIMARGSYIEVIDSGDVSTANEYIDMLVNSGVGKDTIKKAITTRYKPLYLAADKAERKRIEKILKQIVIRGGKKASRYTDSDFKKWLNE